MDTSTGRGRAEYIPGATPVRPADRRVIDIVTREPLAHTRCGAFAEGSRAPHLPAGAASDRRYLGITAARFLAGCLLAIALFVWLVGFVCTLAAEVLLGIYGALALFLLTQVAIGLGERRRSYGA